MSIKYFHKTSLLVSPKWSFLVYFVTCLSIEGVTIKDWPVRWNITGSMWDQVATTNYGPYLSLFNLPYIKIFYKFPTFSIERYIVIHSRTHRQRSYGVMVSTQDSESCDPSSSLGRTSLFSRLKLNLISLHGFQSKLFVPGTDTGLTRTFSVQQKSLRTKKSKILDQCFIILFENSNKKWKKMHC